MNYVIMLCSGMFLIQFAREIRQQIVTRGTSTSVPYALLALQSGKATQCNQTISFNHNLSLNFDSISRPAMLGVRIAPGICSP